MAKLAVVTGAGRRVARPLNVLIPLIQKELDSADEAGLDYFASAGELLIEARGDDETPGQVPAHRWSGWVKKNFELSTKQADRYMRLARKIRDGEDIEKLREFFLDGGRGGLGAALGEQSRDERKAKTKAKWKPFMDKLNALNADIFAQEEQDQTNEIKLHREIALQLVDLGFRAMAMRLHPDKGGSREAMIRLNTVREELKSVAAKRRYVL